MLPTPRLLLDRISIHALRVEGDDYYPVLRCRNVIFLSTPSGWRATADDTVFKHTVPISIHALRVEGDVKNLARAFNMSISIHALRVEGDA